MIKNLIFSILLIIFFHIFFSKFGQEISQLSCFLHDFSKNKFFMRKTKIKEPPEESECSPPDDPANFSAAPINIKTKSDREPGTAMIKIWKSNDSFCEVKSIYRILVAFNTGESIPKFPFVLFGLVYETNHVKYIKTETKFLNYKDQILKTIDEVMELEFVENEESVALKRCLMDVLDRSYQAYSVNLDCYKVFCDQKTKGSTRRSSKSKPIIVSPSNGSKFLPKIPIPKILHGSPNTQTQSSCRSSEVIDPILSNKRKLSYGYLIESGKNPTKKRTTVHPNPNSIIDQNNLIFSNDQNSSNNTKDKNPVMTQNNSIDLSSSNSPNDPNSIAENKLISPNSPNSSVDLNYSISPNSPNSPNSSIDLNYSCSPKSPNSSIDQNNSLSSSNSPFDPNHSLIQEVVNFQQFYGVTPHATNVVNELKFALDKLKALEDLKIKIDSEIKNMLQIEIPNICKKK
jgi:hypothetical protein